jgi:hypothetical protein
MTVEGLHKVTCGLNLRKRNTYMLQQGLKMTVPFKVWDSQRKDMTLYTPKQLYKVVVEYPKTNRTLEFIGMDRGSCIMQAEVAKEEADTLMLMQSEQAITLLNKEKI